jgi:hypothetical protein
MKTEDTDRNAMVDAIFHLRFATRVVGVFQLVLGRTPDHAPAITGTSARLEQRGGLAVERLDAEEDQLEQRMVRAADAHDTASASRRDLPVNVRNTSSSVA